MNGKQRVKVAALERRRDHLVERLAKWERGDPARTRGELAAVGWALRLIRAADSADVLNELESVA
jgi:hypothetical protein